MVGNLRGVFVRRSGTLSADIGTDTVVMDAKSGRYYSLNQTAADIWRRLEAPTRIDDLVETLIDEYRGDAGTMRAEIDSLVGSLMEWGLLETVSRSS